MPKRHDLNKILIIGSGPIIIGQACEFDYSGTQACKALRGLGYQIVLVNSNPATIMTDPDVADATYIEPLNITRLEEIISIERPDALLPNLGGQSGLNLCSELDKAGILEKYSVEVIGVKLDAIERGEDRIAFKETMNELGIEMARSKPAYSVAEAEEIANELGYPVVIRPAYTMGGAGGGLVYNVEELNQVVSRGIAASMVGQVLIEESVLGWEELELEVVRDAKGKMITVCFIENIDPMGVHTGDSFCAAPMLTISLELQMRLQEMAYKIVDAVQVIGGTNVQFAHDPKTDRVCVIEINPRTSRSSALASKATGFPIAYVSSLLACGLTLDEIPCGKYGTLDQYAPSGDYVVIKFARWAFEKFPGSIDKLGTQMRAVGEAMSIGKTYKEAFLKAIRSLEISRYGLGNVAHLQDKPLNKLLEMLNEPSSERQFIMYEALKKGATVEELFNLTKIKPYFIEQMNELAQLEGEIVKEAPYISDETFIKAKKDGFSDRYLSLLTSVPETYIRERKRLLGIEQTFEPIHVSGTQDKCYYFSTYNGNVDSSASQNKKKIMILGSGPNRIGQGIEFDYCCVHAAFALKELGFESIIVNCNPETVSTDYDTSDKLYFEPLTVEDVLAIYAKEKPIGVIAQFGGQTPLNLSSELQKCGVNILGTSPDTINLAEDRDLFREMMEKLEIPMPASGMASNIEQALHIADELGYPLMVRPSFVLGGRGMEVVYDDADLCKYMANAIGVSAKRPILIDRFLKNALELEADAISDGEHVFVPTVMEHIELAGIHSGDSACVLPPCTISPEHLRTIIKYTKSIAKELNVSGLMNMQYAIADEKVYVLEANPRASRTVPLVSKVCDINMIKLATQIITMPYTGNSSPVENLTHKHIPYYGVKEAVFPFNMFHEVDPVLGPEMRSTGEVLGLARSMGLAYFKAMEATQTPLPLSGTVLFSLNDSDKKAALDVAKGFESMGFKVIATGGTYSYFKSNGIECERINKLFEGRPHIMDLIANKQIQILINTPIGKQAAEDDSYMRKAAIRHKISYITNISAAKASMQGIEAAKSQSSERPTSLQGLHKELK